MENRDQIRKALMSDLPVHDNDLAQARKAAFEAVDSAPARSFPVSLLAAAVLLAAAGGWIAWRMTREPGAARHSGELVSAAGEFHVVSALPDSHSLLARDFRDFETRRYATGAPIGRYELRGIESDSITVRDDTGIEATHSIGDFNDAAGKALEREVESYRVALRGGALNAAQVDRLYAIAGFQPESALPVLESVARSGGAVAAQAKQASRAFDEVNRMRGMAAWARQGSLQSRIASVQSLGKLKSPLAAEYLLDLALTADNVTVGLACVESIRGRAEALAAVAESARLQEVRAAAAALLDIPSTPSNEIEDEHSPR